MAIGSLSTACREVHTHRLRRAKMSTFNSCWLSVNLCEKGTKDPKRIVSKYKVLSKTELNKNRDSKEYRDCPEEDRNVQK